MTRWIVGAAAVGLIGCGARPTFPDAELAALLAADDGYAHWSYFEGGRPDGAGCSEHYQCASTLCSSDGGRACGICLKHLWVGEACGKSTEACSRSAACIGGVCATMRKWIGDGCQNDPKGGSFDCDEELVCVPESTGGKCRRALPAGASCAPDRSTGSCRRGTLCGPQGVCAAAQYGPSTVEFCSAAGVCASGKPCDTNGRCADAVLAANAACSFGGGAPCAFGTICSDVGLTCTPLPTEGQPAIIGRCAAGLFPDASAQHLCTRQRGLHAACSTDVWCTEGLECRRGECEVPCQ